MDLYTLILKAYDYKKESGKILKFKAIHKTSKQEIFGEFTDPMKGLLSTQYTGKNELVDVWSVHNMFQDWLEFEVIEEVKEEIQ